MVFSFASSFTVYVECLNFSGIFLKLFVELCSFLGERL